MIEMISEEHIGKFYITDAFENSIFFVSRKHGLIDVKESLFHAELRFIPMSHEIITCTVELLHLLELRDNGISNENYQEFIGMLGGKKDGM